MCHPTRVFREKMVANHVNPALEILLQAVVLVAVPFLWLFGLFHDHIMMKFLNKTYIYNVSWEVRLLALSALRCASARLLNSGRRTHWVRVLVWHCTIDVDRTREWTSVCSTSLRTTT
jgi:hypothetical protein